MLLTIDVCALSFDLFQFSHNLQVQLVPVINILRDYFIITTPKSFFFCTVAVIYKSIEFDCREVYFTIIRFETGSTKVFPKVQY